MSETDSDARKRMALLRAIARLDHPRYQRGDLLIDEVDGAGVATVRPAPIFAELELETLRGLFVGLAQGDL